MFAINYTELTFKLNATVSCWRNIFLVHKSDLMQTILNEWKNKRADENEKKKNFMQKKSSQIFPFNSPAILILFML